MAVLARSVMVDGTTYTKGSTPPPDVADKIRNPKNWVGGVAPPLNSPAPEKKIDLRDVTPTQARELLQIDPDQTGLNLKAPLASPTFTGTPAAPTATGDTNTTQIATTAFVASAVSPKANDNRVIRRFRPELYGATGDGVDDTDALIATLAAMSPGDALELQAGKVYAHNAVLTISTPGISLFGHGELRATAEATSAVKIAADNVTVTDVKFTCPTTTQRWGTPNQHKIVLTQCAGVHLDNVKVDGSAATGIFIERSTGYLIDKPVVKNTRADGIHNTNASTDGRILDPIVVNAGDDCIAVVSYQGDTGICSNIRVRGARVRNSLGGRMFTVVGGEDIEYVGCHGNGSHGAGIYVACESAYTTRGVTDVRFEQITIRGANTVGVSRPDHGAVLIVSERAGYTISDVTVRDVVAQGTDLAASRQIAALAHNGGTVSGILIDDAEFLGGPDQIWSTNVTDSSLYKLINVRNGDLASATAAELATAMTGNPALRTWHYALANRFHAPAVVAVIGSSSTEGVGATVYGRQYVNRLRDLLRIRNPVPGVVGGENYVAAWGGPAEGATPAYTWPVARSAGTGNSNSTGWALKATTLSAANQTLTYTFTGTSVQVWYSVYGGSGNFSVTLDGNVVAASISTSGATDRNAKWTSSALSAGSHTIVLTWVTGGASPVYVHGFAAYNGDESAGIQVYNGGQGSKTSGDFVTNVAQWQPRLASIQPHLVILQLGLNDWQASVPAATVKANLKSIIASVRSGTNTNPSFVIYGSPRVTSGTYAEAFSAITAAWKQVAAEDIGGPNASSGVAYFDLAARQPSPSTDNTWGIYNADLLHLTDRGHSQVADSLVPFISPR